MKIHSFVGFGLLLLASASMWSQDDKPNVVVPAASGPLISAITSNDNSETPMLTPPPVSGQSYPVAPASQERSNYVRGGVTFTSAYSDNVLGATGPSSAPVSDVSYSMWPTLALDETTTRLHWTVNYAPGFTFYQRTSARNQAGPERIDQLPVPPEPARNFQRSGRIPEDLECIQSARLGIGRGGVGWNAGGEFLGDRSDCRPVAQFRESWASPTSSPRMK